MLFYVDHTLSILCIHTEKKVWRLVSKFADCFSKFGDWSPILPTTLQKWRLVFKFGETDSKFGDQSPKMSAKKISIVFRLLVENFKNFKISTSPTNEQLRIVI